MLKKSKKQDELVVEKEPVKDKNFTPVEGQHILKTNKGFENHNREIARRAEFRKQVVGHHAGSKSRAKPNDPKTKPAKYFPAKFGSQHERVVAQREGRRQMLLATKGAKAQ